MKVKFIIVFINNGIGLEVMYIKSLQTGILMPTVFHELQVDMNDINSDEFSMVDNYITYKCNVQLTMSEDDFEFEYSNIEQTSI